jgi:leader peptidase (prepilin peptidase) / N-methyltransferase
MGCIGGERQIRWAGTLPETGAAIPDDMPSPSLLDRIAGWPWAETVTVVLGFAWGAIVGSFLNVVAHRLPRGESVVHHRSRCPRCGAAIRARDNVPVLGWLWLRGRCRDCGEPIAARYPLVEAGCGMLVMVLVWAELAGGGRWLPRFTEAFPSGIDRLLGGDWSLLLTCVLHAAAVLMVVTWSLLDLDGTQPIRPRAALAIALVLAFIAAVPVSGPGGVLPGGADWPAGSPRGQAVVASATGALAGWALGRGGTTAGIRLGLPLLGSVLGWQAVTVVALATAAAVRMATASGGMPKAAAGLVLAALGTLGIALQGPLRAVGAKALRVVLGP